MDRMMELVTQKSYVQVAFISVTPQVREFTPKLKAYLRPRVCQRGGDHVLMTGSSGQGAAGTVSFEVLSSKGAAAGPGPVTD
jgi:hypothetical protein